MLLKFFKYIFKMLFNRFVVVLLLLIIQIFIIIYAFYKISTLGYSMIVVFELLGIITVLFILNRDFSPEYKIPWIIFVLLMPLAGTCFYLIYGTKRIPKRFTKRMSKIINNRAQKILYHKDCSLKDPNHYKLARFVKNTSGNAIFRNTKVTYLSPGEMFYKELIKALREAKKFIFLEFYIIEEGKMWNSILKIIEEKVEEGIDVRLIYDDFGCMRKIPYNFKKKLTKKNIKTVNFNPFIPRLSTFLNYRDHRKIVVIDGNIGFTGGANIADEYINVKKLYGHWQDSAVMLEGDAVFSLTSLFLELWDFSTGENTDMKDYLPTNIVDSDGFIQVFGDSPFDNSPITANVYINIINNAKKYVYITTPYLIIDNEIFTALKNCAQSGIDVRIITPEIPDKKLVFSLTQSYYKKLIENGIKIYQYTPGFMHSKSILSDDHIAMIGSVNLDFRSLYLHFEVSCLLYQNEAIKDIKRDFENFFNVSRLITLKDIKKISIFQKVFAFFLKAFAPLL